MSFNVLLEDVRRQLDERMTFDQLVGVSDPKRVARSSTVKVPPLHFDAWRDAECYYFNVKSFPSTTGLRHKGYIKCFKPKDPNTPLEKCDCEVDCTCPDYKYRWAWANKQRGSGRVGPQSVNQAWNQAPRKTNPTGRPGTCKHLLALRDWIYGKFRSFASDRDSTLTASRLDKMVKQAATRDANFSAEVAKAKERDARIKQGIAARTAQKANELKGITPATPTAPSATVRPQPAIKATQPSVPATRPTPPQSPVESVVVSGMTTRLEEEVDNLIAQASGAPVVAATRRESPSKQDNSETIDMLREIRDLVRHLAGDDVPPDFAAREGENEKEKQIEPGIPTDAVKAREDN